MFRKVSIKTVLTVKLFESHLKIKHFPRSADQGTSKLDQIIWTSGQTYIPPDIQNTKIFEIPTFRVPVNSKLHKFLYY